jgi:hypothetical protein
VSWQRQASQLLFCIHDSSRLCFARSAPSIQLSIHHHAAGASLAYMPYIVCPCLVVVSLFVGCAFGFVALLGRVVQAAGYCWSVLCQYFISQYVKQVVLKYWKHPTSLWQRGAVSPLISFWHDHVSVAVTRQ